MAERKPRSCSECQSESEHDFKLKIAEIDYNGLKEISLLFKPPEGYGDEPIPISLSDYSDSEGEDDQDMPSCKCLNDISNEEREFFNLPLEYVVGEAVADGSCFFDSFRQGLHNLDRATITIAELRTICAEVANKSPLWLIDTLPLGVTLAEFTNRTLLSDSWGDTELHGRILCQHFNVQLYVLEGHADFGVMRSLVSASGVRCVRDVPFGRSDTIYIINRGRNHFEPLLRVSPEFENVHRAIKAGDVLRLEAALVDHRNVLYYSCAERQLEQCSLRDAILSYNIRIVDLLYEHWTGAAFAAHSPHFHNLQRLGRALVKARDSCLPELHRYQQMFVDVHCIIEFNKFEVQLYQQLNDYPVSQSNDRKRRLLRMIDILITTLDLYELYSDKNIRATKNEVVDILLLQPLLNDKSTIYQKYLHYAMYEMYYRKLDFCVSKLILEYVHSLKEKLKLPENAYQNIECALYYFLYRVNEEWRLYMPENRPKGRKHAFLFDTDWDFSHIRDDYFRMFSGPVIYFEWVKFRKSLRNFKEVLASTSVADNFREKGRLPPEEVNSLTLLPYLRDEHSLRKVVEYLEGAERAIQHLPPVEAALVVQRALQVAGECLKSTAKSLHLSSTTKALLQVYIPDLTLKHLHTLRDNFSKIRDGKLIRKVNIEETNPGFFLEVAKDLEWIKKAILKVLSVYKPMFEKYLLDEGLRLVTDRLMEFPFIYGYWGSAMNQIQEYICYEHKLYTKLEDQIIKRMSDSVGVNITRQFARELGNLHKNKEILHTELYQRDVLIISYVETLLQPVYSILQNIKTQINEWSLIKNELEQLQLNVTLPEYPNETMKLIVDEVKSRIKFKNQKQILKKLSLLKDYSSEWCVVKTILEYIVVKMSLFRKNHYEIKRDCFTNMLNGIINGQLNSTGINNVKTLLSFIEHEVKHIWKIKQLPIPKDLLAYKYEAIKRLEEYMSKKKFITYKEIKYLKEKLDISDIGQPIMEKILSGEEITGRERDSMYTNIGDLDDRCKAIVENLVIGSKRDECALQCLAQRAEVLRHAITGEDVLRLVQRYNQDEGFRILTESLLADIYTVHVERNLWNLLDDNMRLLAEFPMRNILDHGNPLLEVIGKMLDSSDFPATLFRFALRVVEDEPALAELARLYERGIKRKQAEREWSGPRTPRLHHYFNLLPSESGLSNVSQSSNGNKQNYSEKDVKSSEDGQVDEEHIDTIERNGPMKKRNNKQETVKDREIFISLSGVIYCIKYAKHEEKKVKSFKSKVEKKKLESFISKMKALLNKIETEACVDTENNAKDETKSKVKENENAGTHIEGASQKMANFPIKESSTKSEKVSIRPHQGQTREMSVEEIIDNNNYVKVDESSTIQTRKREDSHIKIPKYFPFNHIEEGGDLEEMKKMVNFHIKETSTKARFD